MEIHYGYLLKALHWFTDQSMTRALAEMDLTAAQGRVMAYLSHREDPPCARDVEEVFQLSHPTVSGLLSRLEKKQFLELRTDKADRRVKRIYILPKGRDFLDRIRQVIDANEESLIRGFSEEEAAQFASYLNRAIQNMKQDLNLKTCCEMGEQET